MNLTAKTLRNAPCPGDIKNLYMTAFPKEELLPWWILRLTTVLKDVELTGYYDADTFCGFRLWGFEPQQVFTACLPPILHKIP